LWDSRKFENVSNLSNDDNLSLNKQLTKIKCFPKGGGFCVGGVDGRCWIKTYPHYFQWVSN